MGMGMRSVWACTPAGSTPRLPVPPFLLLRRYAMRNGYARPPPRIAVFRESRNG